MASPAAFVPLLPRLPERQDRAGRIGDDAERSVPRNLGHLLQYLRPEGAAFFIEIWTSSTRTYAIQWVRNSILFQLFSL